MESKKSEKADLSKKKLSIFPTWTCFYVGNFFVSN